MNEIDIISAAESLFRLTDSTWKHKGGMVTAAFKIGINKDNVYPVFVCQYGKDQSEIQWIEEKRAYPIKKGMRKTGSRRT